jgi:hypothetical protein
MMNLHVKRFEFGNGFAIGKLLIDGEDSGLFTLEDEVRQIDSLPVEKWKVPGETAIPSGTYKVIVDMSQRFRRELPHILDVPGFTGVRIHSGNRPQDTEGCLLVGKTWDKSGFVGKSKEAFEALFAKIKAVESVEVTIG